MKKHYLIILIILAIGYLFSASPVVDNILVTTESGGVIITYDLTAEAECQIIVLASADAGATYNIFPQALTGAVGDSEVSGTAKEIIWIPSTDGMEIGATYKVKIIARDNPINTNNPIAAEELSSLVRVEGGTFNNGTANVTISDFYMGKYEVTQAEYEAVIGRNPTNSNYGVGSDYPVYYVSWFDAIKYCNIRSLQEGLLPCYNYNNEGTDPNEWSLGWNNVNNHTNYAFDTTANGYRLPTEMEWMYAAKGGNQELESGYNQYAGTNVNAELTNYAWYSGNNGSWGTAQFGSKVVGTKFANQLGLYDMSGNVWEWSWDIYSSYSPSAQTDPVGPTSGSQRVFHGGSWDISASYCLVAYRYNYSPSVSNFNIGFRLTRSIPVSEAQVVADPVITPISGEYEEVQTVTISCETEDVGIYYTLDGSDPDQSSILYVEAFELIETSTIKARAFKDTWDASAVVTAEYVINTSVTVPEGFVLVESGTFNNGTADATISNFYMSKYEVTQAEYEAVMNTNPSYFSDSDKPVEQVSWYNAVEYCNARSLQEGLTPCYDTTDWSCDFSANGYRLPTEMEWMYAAKGGNQEPESGYNQYSGTNIESELTDYVWYLDNNGSYGTAFYGTMQVGTKLANQLGLYDMSGNVWEWCNDWYGGYSSSPETDPVGPSSGSSRVVRGGGWSNSASYCRVAFRYGFHPTFSSSNGTGFRIARSSY